MRRLMLLFLLLLPPELALAQGRTYFPNPGPSWTVFSAGSPNPGYFPAYNLVYDAGPFYSFPSAVCSYSSSGCASFGIDQRFDLTAGSFTQQFNGWGGLRITPAFFGTSVPAGKYFFAKGIASDLHVEASALTNGNGNYVGGEFNVRQQANVTGNDLRGVTAFVDVGANAQVSNGAAAVFSINAKATSTITTRLVALRILGIYAKADIPAAQADKINNIYVSGYGRNYLSVPDDSGYYAAEVVGDKGLLAGGVNGQLQLSDVGARPACDAAHRGSFWYEAGGAGVADTTEVCRKDGADAYAWVSVY